ncbi:hypothetical protein ACP70R_032139 [Stipagrostis hirtigluma subsp. patula]
MMVNYFQVNLLDGFKGKGFLLKEIPAERPSDDPLVTEGGKLGFFVNTRTTCK